MIDVDISEDTDLPVIAEAPRYFTCSKRKREDIEDDLTEEEQFRKIVKAILVTVAIEDDNIDRLREVYPEIALAATEKYSIPIPLIYKEAVSHQIYGVK